jgi:hypothetical protein
VQASVTDMLYDYMPPREVTDRLIARFFRGKEPAWRTLKHPQKKAKKEKRLQCSLCLISVLLTLIIVMFHVPTFMKQVSTLSSSLDKRAGNSVTNLLLV